MNKKSVTPLPGDELKNIENARAKGNVVKLDYQQIVSLF